MLSVNEDQTVELEALDSQERPLFSVAALLQDLQGEKARLTTECRKELARLRWGSPVRFWLEAKTISYQATGIVVGIEREETSLGEEAGELTLTLKLWELRPKSQQRTGKRRRTRLTLEYRTVNTENQVGTWKAGSTLDLSTGGMRFRTECREETMARIEVRFSLTGRKGTRLFERQGQVLRTGDMGKTAPAREVAVKFKTASPVECAALKQWLTESC